MAGCVQANTLDDKTVISGGALLAHLAPIRKKFLLPTGGAPITVTGSYDKGSYHFEKNLKLLKIIYKLAQEGE